MGFWKRIASRLGIFVPNVAVWGYALFLAINAAGVWGGVFPFLPIAFQTHTILFWFFLAQALTFSLCYFASAVGVYFLPGPTRRFLVPLSCAPYLVGWICLIAAIYLHARALPLVIAGGALLGLGSAGFYMLWQRLFASLDADRGNRDLLLGTALGALIYFALYLIPQAVTAYLIPLVFMPLFGLAITLRSRDIDLHQPMFEDVPRRHPRVYRRVLHDYWRSALSVGVLGFCTGTMRGVAISEPQVGTLVNVLSMGAMLVAAVGVLALWQGRNVRLNVVGAYRIAFPLVISAFVALPFLNTTYARWMAAALYAFYSVAIVLMMVQCAQASRDRGINPVFIYGFFGGVVYTLHELGFVTGTFSEELRVTGIEPLAVLALVAVYALGMMYFVGQGGFRRALGRSADAESVELIAPPAAGDVRDAGAGAGGSGSAGGTQPANANEARPAGASGVRPASADSVRLAQASSASSTRDAQKDVAGASAPPRTHASESAQPAGAPADASPSALRHHATDQRKQDARRQDAAEPTYQDRLSKQVQLVRQRYRLSAREAEVMELIARGNTVARIAEDLFVSENTIRTHSKRIYTKLDIHSKQELRDLIEDTDPRDLND